MHLPYLSGTEVLPEQETTTTTRPKILPPYNVILMNDDHHSMHFVIEVLCKIIGCSIERAFVLMMEAHESGRAVIWTGSKEVAELKHEQIITCHEVRDDGRNLGPLGCYIEPAPGA